MTLINDKQIQMRASEEFIRSIDEWRRHQPDLPARAEAIRRLIELGLYTSAIKIPIITSVDNKGVTHYPHVGKDGYFKVANPALGSDKKLAVNQIPVASITELIDYIKRGFHVRMSDYTPDGADLTAPQSINIEYPK